MKSKCNIVKDLLLIYGEEEVSEDTKIFVEEHLQVCDECRNYYSQINESVGMAEQLKNEKIQIEKENKIIKKSFGKIRKRWIASILCVILIAPLVWFGGRLTVNQMDGKGLCFTNIDDMLLCREYLENIEEQDFDSLYEMMDIRGELHSIKEAYNSSSDSKDLKDFKEVKLNDSGWYVSENMVAGIAKGEKEFWENAIKDYKEGVLIPEKIWNNVVKEPCIVEIDWFNTPIKFYFPSEPKVSQDMINPYENPGFIYLQTKWGNYYVYGLGEYTVDGESFAVGAENLLEASDDSVNLFWYMDVIPAEIVEEAEIQIQDSKDEHLEWLEAEYGDILKMTDEEYEIYMKDKYETAFNGYWAKGYSITDISYIDEDQSESKTSGEEIITMHVELANKKEKRETGKIEFRIKDDKIKINGLSSNSDMLYDLFEAMINN